MKAAQAPKLDSPPEMPVRSRLISGMAAGVFGFAFVGLAAALLFSLDWGNASLVGAGAFCPFFFIGARWFIAAAIYAAFVNFIVSAATLIVGALGAIFGALNL